MLGRSMETWPTEALQRTADARAMCAGRWHSHVDVGCLLTVAFGGQDGAVAALGRFRVTQLACRFDRLVFATRVTPGRPPWPTRRHLSVDTLRLMCANRARRILASRSIAAQPVKATAHSECEQVEECVR